MRDARTWETQCQMVMALGTCGHRPALDLPRHAGARPARLDRRDPPAPAREFRGLVQGELSGDCGLGPDVPLAPVSVDDDGSVGTFMIPPGAGPGRFFWFGNGDPAFFPTFREILECAVAPGRWRHHAAR
ncbi:hypothetical protein PUR71_07815 [Streptomyces sp. SP17BM10]|uniref:hypothetical protein n=1 Tax=Streptomyces sp. SP17BM10 TaxID=3002530 RepID=UPI002E75CD99|nr:hypothetical protein [Streptomyces sp. SP17BM10]MEE1782820.1 hypothetical protein [Streptomyces sp. SP17BM10]